MRQSGTFGEPDTLAYAVVPSLENDSEEEYEYEYSSHETEAFLIDLDLSSLNGELKSTGRKRMLKPRGPNTNATLKKSRKAAVSDDDDSQSDDADVAEAEDRSKTMQQDTPAAKDLQILDLASTNPIVQFGCQTYSCSWSDMIGTSLFFTKPPVSTDSPVLKTTPDYALLGTSHIKLLGKRVKMTPKPQPASQAATPQSTASSASVPVPADGSSFPGFVSASSHVNKERKRQAHFLDRLMQAKRARGETDIVNTITGHKANLIQRPNFANLSDEQRMRISNLNDRIVKGDARAVTALKEIYSQLDGTSEVRNLDDMVVIDVSTPAPATPD